MNREFLELPDGVLTQDEVNQLWQHFEYIITEHHPIPTLPTGWECAVWDCDGYEDNWKEHLLEILNSFEFEET